MNPGILGGFTHTHTAVPLLSFLTNWEQLVLLLSADSNIEKGKNDSKPSFVAVTNNECALSFATPSLPSYGKERKHPERFTLCLLVK